MTARNVICGCCLLSLAACKPLADGAKEEFSKGFTCPPERVEVRTREDVDIYDLQHGKFEPPEPPVLQPSPGAQPLRHHISPMRRRSLSDTPQPPAEVAADPGRLAMWNKQQADKEKEAREYLKSFHHLFEVRGCGHTVIYDCRRPGQGSSAGAYYMCDEQKLHYPPGTPAW